MPRIEVVSPALCRCEAWDETVEQGQRLQDRVASDGVGSQQEGVGRACGSKTRVASWPLCQGLVGVAERGGFCFEVRSSSWRADALGIPTALASLAQVLEDSRPH